MRVGNRGNRFYWKQFTLKTTVYKKRLGDKIYDKKCGQIKEENRRFGYRDYLG